MNRIFIISIGLLLLPISALGYSGFPLNDQQCDELIRMTQRDYKSRSASTIYNTQVCLNIAGYFEHNGKFTTNYGPVTEQAALNYLNGKNNNQAKLALALKTKEEEKAKQEKARLELLKVQQQAESQSQTAPTNPNSETNSSSSPSLPTSEKPYDNSTNPNSQTDGAPSPSTTTESANNFSNVPVNEVATIDRQPQTTDRIIINSIYFLVALPFILFAISVLMAFIKVFRKEKFDSEY